MAKKNIEQVKNPQPFETQNEIVSDVVDEMGVISDETKVVGDIKTEGHLAIAGVLDGNIDAKGNVVITGTVKGTVKCNNLMVDAANQKIDVNAKGQVIIKNEASVNGQVHCGGLAIQGTLNGNVTSTGQVGLSQTAVIIGDIKAQSIGIEPGAKLKGNINIG